MYFLFFLFAKCDLGMLIQCAISQTNLVASDRAIFKLYPDSCKDVILHCFFSYLCQHYKYNEV